MRKVEIQRGIIIGVVVWMVMSEADPSIEEIGVRVCHGDRRKKRKREIEKLGGNRMV